MTESQRGDTFTRVVTRRLSRRALLQAGLRGGAALGAAIYLPLVGDTRGGRRPPRGRGLRFTPIPAGTADAITVPPGYEAQVLLRWGDPVTADAPPFDPHDQQPAAQAEQLGYNCDYVGFFPLPYGSANPNHGLLVINHEYTNPELMFADYRAGQPTRRQTEVQLAAHGLSIVEVERRFDGRWRVVRGSPYSRRITGTTPATITGPAAGHPWLRTSADPTGRHVLGTLGNCSAGRTPWGTVLSAEENFHLYFGGRDAIPPLDLRRKTHARYGLPTDASDFGWEQHLSRFDLGVEPSEPFRFGWVVEVDPYDPTWTPRKRTALGRFRREGAATTIAPSGQVVLYSGDDITFEYVYKFVTAAAYQPGNRAANRDLLDDGILYAARFNDDGTGIWLPLITGFGRLTPRYGFPSQGDIALNTLHAADHLGPTKMDRPEGIAVNPHTGRVYIALTRNLLRGREGQQPTNAANPREKNRYGHVIELIEDDDDPGGQRFTWRIFLLCGDPDDPSTYYAGYPKGRVSALSSPDNLTFDQQGHLWIATDGQPKYLDANDGLYAVPVDGPERGYVRRFLGGVPGCEICSPNFTPDETTLFLSVQHPGEGSTLAAPSSRWPDGHAPPRPSVVAVRAHGGDRIGAV